MDSTIDTINRNSASQAWERWIQSYTTCGSEELKICEWAYDLANHLTNELGRAGFSIAYSHHAFTRRILYWCWALKNSVEAHDTDFYVPLPAPCKENTNDPDERNEFEYVFDTMYWVRLEAVWTPSFMNQSFMQTIFQGQFFGLLGEFCWRHIDTEYSRALQKYRAIMNPDDETGSGDEGRADQTKYFKGNKEFY